MSLFRRWVKRARRDADVDLDRELAGWVDELAARYEASGASRAEARRRALAETGGLHQVKEAVRDVRRDLRAIQTIDNLRQDLTYAVRALRKSPGFSIVAILSLAIGIGANTTIFTFVNGVLLRPLPYADSSRLVVLHEHKLGSAEHLNVHPVNYVEWRARAHSFESLVLVQAPPLNVIGSNGAEQVARLLTTAELFKVFRVNPALGRGFTEEETRPGNDRVAIIGYGFWQRWYGGDRGVIGRQLAVPDGSLTIIGVAPARFRVGAAEPDVFTPMTIDPVNPAATGSRAFECYGRLRTGVTLAAAVGT
jgi:hypothetical protein